VAESGDIVVAVLGEDATVKRVYIADERIELRPENPRSSRRIETHQNSQRW
jgi:repressor LexA